MIDFIESRGSAGVCVFYKILQALVYKGLQAMRGYTFTPLNNPPARFAPLEAALAALDRIEKWRYGYRPSYD